MNIRICAVAAAAAVLCLLCGCGRDLPEEEKSSSETGSTSVADGVFPWEEMTGESGTISGAETPAGTTAADSAASQTVFATTPANRTETEIDGDALFRDPADGESVSVTRNTSVTTIKTQPTVSSTVTATRSETIFDPEEEQKWVNGKIPG